MDDGDWMNQYKYQGIPVIITFSDAKTGSSEGSATYHSLPEPHA